ncbi:unnamed protein product [Discosporangium mesarthrocarpum]
MELSFGSGGDHDVESTRNDEGGSDADGKDKTVGVGVGMGTWALERNVLREEWEALWHVRCWGVIMAWWAAGPWGGTSTGSYSERRERERERGKRWIIYNALSCVFWGVCLIRCLESEIVISAGDA